MISPAVDPDFSVLLSGSDAKRLLKRLTELESKKTNANFDNQIKPHLQTLSEQWQKIIHANDINTVDENEKAATDWLISLFNTLFAHQHVILVRGAGEPEYFPAKDNQPAHIEFAHGFFQSALHECSHFFIAGERRRQLSDFGYWYAPDGRTEAQQQAFERVEIKPQALECLFTLACKRSFQVSQDNLFATFDTSTSTFAQDVYQQAKAYITAPHTIPHDAKILLQALLMICTVD
ncbi:elongation factor P hydroxylase [Psychrobacter sp. Ps5]|uniref:elongation factor P hydroxylase n=1 Tax=uncultured Psychrobacter sp. TaxID=259303 RepID=UPI001EDD62A8|nr:elongation factor P hydroxylase [Psychrobacter sp. Ps5]MCG3861016.1 elongation factor P hydroxylase [Psychrobacter sp. Ps5]